ncbi:MAG: phosphatidylglycerol lysyltransferase domain-containing protein [Aliihoeflea sp.]
MSRKLFDRICDRNLAELPPANLTEADRLALFMQHGDFSLAYSSAVQAGLAHFGDARGYIAHGRKMGSLIALGDPVCAKDDRADLLDAFIDAAKTPCFAEIGRDTAENLAGRGFRVAMIGIDSSLDLASFDFSGKRKETVRYSERWLEKKGYQIAEAENVAGAEEMIAELSARWRQSRIVKKREMSFLNRPLLETGGPMMRRFVLIEPDGRIGCLVYFDPICRDGEVVGYLTAFKRKLPDTTSHAEIGLTKRAVDTFKAEGRERVMLGLSPLCDIEPSGFAESAPFRAMLRGLYRSGAVNRKVFNLQGHAAFKRRFHGREEPRYFAWNAGAPFMHFISLMRLSKAF